MFSDSDYQRLIDLAEQPANYGELSTIKHWASLSNASCGDKIAVGIHLDENNRIKVLKWTGQGCVVSRASMSVLSEHLLDKPVAVVDTLSVDELLKLLQLDVISSGRIKCLTLGLEAVKQALKELP